MVNDEIALLVQGLSEEDTWLFKKFLEMHLERQSGILKSIENKIDEELEISKAYSHIVANAKAPIISFEELKALTEKIASAKNLYDGFITNLNDPQTITLYAYDILLDKIICPPKDYKRELLAILKHRTPKSSLAHEALHSIQYHTKQNTTDKIQNIETFGLLAELSAACISPIFKNGKLYIPWTSFERVAQKYDLEDISHHIFTLYGYFLVEGYGLDIDIKVAEFVGKHGEQGLFDFVCEIDKTVDGKVDYYFKKGSAFLIERGIQLAKVPKIAMKVLEQELKG